MKHLQNVQKQQLAIAMASDPTVLQKFKTGFAECSDEVLSYVAQIDVDSSLKHRLKSHLSKCITNVEQMAQFNLPTITYPFLSNANPFFRPGSPSKSSEVSTGAGDQNNNPRIQIPQGLQLIPSRLPTGEFAFLVPNSSNLPYFSSLAAKPQEHNPRHNSAFAAVVPSSNPVRTLSPPLSPTHSNASSQNEDAAQNPRTPSPHGFRPVNPGQKHNIFIPPSSNDPLQKPTPVFQREPEVKTMRYPINPVNSLENNKKFVSPKKVIEPLCIITNQAERYKQAQTVDEAANYEENRLRGVKRKFHDGLLGLAATHDHNAKAKFMKVTRDDLPSTSRNYAQIDNTKETCSEDNSESNNDMWRPW